jgi:hypothetical protein
MSAPTPGVIDARIAEVIELLTHDPSRCGLPHPRTGQPQRRCLGCEYRWTYYAAHDRSSGAEVKVAIGGSADPVASVVEARTGLRSACKKVDEALRSVMGAERVLLVAMASANGGARPEREYADATTMLHSGELEDSLDAQRRRASRGEGFGVG